MSEQIGTNGGELQPAPRRKRVARSSNVSRPVYVILQMLDGNGDPMAIDKRKIRTIAVERDPNKVIQMIDSEEHENAVYLRIMLPPGTRAGIPNRPKTD